MFCQLSLALLALHRFLLSPHRTRFSFIDTAQLALMLLVNRFPYAPYAVDTGHS